LSSVEIRPLDRDLGKYRERLTRLADSSLLSIGNPIPIWTLIGWLIFGLIGIGGGLAIWRMWQISEPIVGAVQQWAPLMGGAFSMLMFTLAMIPFFFIFQIVMSLLRW